MRRLAWLSALVCLFASPALAAEMAIVGAKVYASPDAAPIDNATILMRDGRITAVGPSNRLHPGPGAQVIDARGLVATAGFWNSHVHLTSPAMAKPSTEPAVQLSGQLEAMLTHWGFTTVFDIASESGEAMAIRRRIAAGEVRGPNILTVDAPFFPNGGVPIYVKGQSDSLSSYEIGDPTKAALRARKQLAAGADGVKLFAGAIVGPPIGVLPMPLDAATAIVAEAHRVGKPAFAHPSNLEGTNVAIDSGVDILAHTTPDGGEPWTPDLIARLKAHNMALIPTLTLWIVELSKDKAPQAAIDRFEAIAQGQLKAYSDAGGQILFGTDVGYTDTFDTSDEYRLMAGAGLSWRQILASLTTAPSQRFGFKAKGRLAPGMDGDIVLLAADPAVDAKAFAKVAYTIRAGTVIYQARP